MIEVRFFEFLYVGVKAGVDFSKTNCIIRDFIGNDVLTYVKFMKNDCELT